MKVPHSLTDAYEKQVMESTVLVEKHHQITLALRKANVFTRIYWLIKLWLIRKDVERAFDTERRYLDQISKYEK